MEKGIQKLFKEISSTLAEIRAGDIMALYATVWGALLIAAVIILAQKNTWTSVVLLILSPIPIFIMTVVTKALVSRFRKDLSQDNKNQAEQEKIKELQNTTDQRQQVKTAEAKEEIDIPKSAWQMCRVAEEFSSSFRHIRDAFVLESEKDSTDVFAARHKIAQIHIQKLTEIFQSIKYHLNRRGELEQNMVRLIDLFGKYSQTLKSYQYMRSQQVGIPPGIPLPYGSLENYVEELFGDKATKTLGEVDSRVESIIQILTPYVRGESTQNKSELRYSRFHRRTVHLEWRVNADAQVVNNYLLQHYVGVLHTLTTADRVRYEVDRIESFNPQNHDVFQYGFIAHGKKVTPTHKTFMVGESEMTIDSRIEALSDMFFITISQGKKDVSIVSFDTDFRDTHQFTVGLRRELAKAFNVQFM
ncbi:MAG TPA: hypothetical protein VN843_10145 [Anaerolineales bacterium]|nr:hypothetical protein [Anaerolineales bacterium]